MPPSKIRFVTACQQLLALALVLAVLTPAASVISLDVVHDRPSDDFAASGGSAALSAYTQESARASSVPDEVVDPSVTQYDLTDPDNVVAPSGSGRTARSAAGDSTVTSVAEPVEGYGAVGVTWEPGATVPEDEISLQVRTRTDGTWSGWMDLGYDADHGPDPGTAEAKHARPGTDALLVGDVDDVQVQVASAAGELPAGLELAVVDPGQAARTAVEEPALDTGEGESPAAPSEDETAAGADTDGDIALQAATFTPKPKIYSRAQWGADERMRDKSSLKYFEVHAGFVHHTVNANDYSRAEVPGIIRSIYAYHTKSRGWSDIGYNFLVDRFGRIWEGRAGGVDRPVVGAHTLNYNDYSFAMSAIGNFDLTQPSSAMIQAYGALFAWKLSLHGVSASSTQQQVGAKSFPAINGHRDAAATACPGRYLYARLADIRQLAAAAQRGWAGRELESDLASTPHPDLVARRASDGQVFVIPTGGLTALANPVTATNGLGGSDRTIASPDLTGDGLPDLVVQSGAGAATIRPGTASGTFGAPLARGVNRLKNRDLVTPVGDLNGDGTNDLVARGVNSGRLEALLGRGNATFAARRLTTGWAGYNLLSGVGDATADGRADLLARDGAGRLWLFPGIGKGRFGERIALARTGGSFSTISGLGDFTGDGRPDLFVRRSNGHGYVLPALGGGSYGTALGPITNLPKAAQVVGVGQLVRDGTPDVVVRSGGSVSVLGNLGGTETRAPIATGTRIRKAKALFNAGDWDRDGHGDIIVRNARNGLDLRRGDGAGHFGPAVSIGTGFGKVRLLAAVGDMTGDGWPDLMGQPAGGAMRIYPGNGLGGLLPSYVAHRAVSATGQVPVGRWTADGAPDSLFRKGATTTLYAGNGPGGLSSARAVSLNLSRYDWVIGISDIGLTGHADLVARRISDGALYLIPGTTTGFGKPRFLAQGMGVYDLAG